MKIAYGDYRKAFPFDRYDSMREGQEAAFKQMADATGPLVLQAPVGSGKTGIGFTYLKALQKQGLGPLFYIAPNKALVEQVHTLHPDVQVVYGRNEHPCFYYEGEDLKADEIPCSMLTDCPHRVDQKTGETHHKGAVPCPYLQQKYEAKKNAAKRIIVCTNAFFLFTVMFSGEFEPKGVVVDEAHRLAESIRSVLSTEITDWRIKRAVEVLDEFTPRQCEHLLAFLESMKRMVKRYAMGKETLLEEDQVKRLYETLMTIDTFKLKDETRRAISNGKLNRKTDREVLKQIEDIIRAIRRFQHALRFAMSGETAKGYPLNYVFAYGKTEMGERDKVQYKIVVKDYYVIPLIRLLLPKEATLAYSATISDPQLFAFENGIGLEKGKPVGKFISLPSHFPIENARIYMPTDTPDLSFGARKAHKRRGARKSVHVSSDDARHRQLVSRTLRQVARSAKQFAKRGHRSLVLVVSNAERKKFVELALEEGLDVLTYSKELPAKECIKRFRDDKVGDCLVGTTANFAEGIDLPEEVAPVIYFFRPSYPRPDDPQSVFEERRFKQRKWALWNWRVMIQLLQVRGRNIRSATDRGVTFLISQHFRKFAFQSLPEWLQPAYRGKLTFEGCEKDAFKLLK